MVQATARTPSAPGAPGREPASQESLFAPPARPLPDAARILIVRFSSLGDVVKCTALPRLIKARYPRARITMVTSREFLELIADNPHLEQAIGFDRRGGESLLALASRLRAEPFDLIVDVHKSLRSRLLGALLRGPRVAYSKRTLQRLLLINFRCNTYRHPTGKEEDFLAGLAPYGVRDDGLGTELNLARVAQDSALHERLRGELARLAAWRRAGRPVLGLAPVAAWELKRWPRPTSATPAGGCCSSEERATRTFRPCWPGWRRTPSPWWDAPLCWSRPILPRWPICWCPTTRA